MVSVVRSQVATSIVLLILLFSFFSFAGEIEPALLTQPQQIAVSFSDGFVERFTLAEVSSSTGTAYANAVLARLAGLKRRVANYGDEPLAKILQKIVRMRVWACDKNTFLLVERDMKMAEKSHILVPSLGKLTDNQQTYQLNICAIFDGDLLSPLTEADGSPALGSKVIDHSLGQVFLPLGTTDVPLDVLFADSNQG